MTPAQLTRGLHMSVTRPVIVAGSEHARRTRVCEEYVSL